MEAALAEGAVTTTMASKSPAIASADAATDFLIVRSFASCPSSWTGSQLARCRVVVDAEGGDVSAHICLAGHARSEVVAGKVAGSTSVYNAFRTYGTFRSADGSRLYHVLRGSPAHAEAPGRIASYRELSSLPGVAVGRPARAGDGSRTRTPSRAPGPKPGVAAVSPLPRSRSFPQRHATFRSRRSLAT